MEPLSPSRPGAGDFADANLRELFHFYAPEKLYALGKEISPGEEIEVGPLPDAGVETIVGLSRQRAPRRHEEEHRPSAQEAAKHWSEAWARGERFRPLPKCPESEKAAAFAEIWRETFAPLHDWLRDAALAFGRRVANAYEAFRLSEAVMTYDDQVRLALRVLELPAVRRELASERLSVLLDEAQDTDPRQFEVLRRVAGLGDDPDQTDDQSFCIVGDFQQAIYAPRSDLGIYRRVHDEISAEPRGTSSRLQVTFRCDAAIIDFVNRIFPPILNNAGGQCAFETLVARDDAGPGQVVRWVCPDEPEQAAGKKIIGRGARPSRGPIRGAADSGAGPRRTRRERLVPGGRALPEEKLAARNSAGTRRAGPARATPLVERAAARPHARRVADRPDLGRGASGGQLRNRGRAARNPGRFGQRHGPLYGRRRRQASPRPARFHRTRARSRRALKILREACAQADAMPLHQAVHQMLEKTQLRERLNSIAEMELENAGRELDDFLAVIAGRSAEGVTLAELAEELRLGLAQVHPAEEEIRDAIQLLTSHKAKGLEWQAVIVPYVFRTIESKSPPYPRVVSGEAGREIVCRDKADFASQARDFVTERERQQLQRLLYVMSTRAKRTLVLVDDEALFAGQSRRGGWSRGRVARTFWTGRIAASWKALPETASSPEKLLPASARIHARNRDSVPLPDLSREDVRQAVARAGTFPRRITPHALAVHARDEAEPEKQIEREDDPSADVGGRSRHSLRHLVARIRADDSVAATRGGLAAEICRSAGALAAAGTGGAGMGPVPPLRTGALAGGTGTADPGRVAFSLAGIRRRGMPGGRDGPGGLYGERIGLARDRLEDEPARAGGKRGPRRDLSRANPTPTCARCGRCFPPR